VLFGDGDNGASTLTFHALPSPSAASKFLALLVALVALSTADAAAGDKLQGSAGAGYEYEMKTSQVLTDAQSLSTAISAGSYWDSFAAGDYTSDIAPHVNGAKTTLSGTTYTAFTSKYSGTGIKAGIADYITAAIVSSDFQDLNPQISHPEARRVVTRP
jgi:nitrous oxidase accessory protein NosD